jgi:hypothetical protein
MRPKLVDIEASGGGELFGISMCMNCIKPVFRDNPSWILCAQIRLMLIGTGGIQTIG